MRTTSTKLGSLAAIALAACMALHAPRAVAQAQNAQRCAMIDNDAERLACYDRALRPAPAPTPARPTAGAAAATAPAPAVTSPPAAPAAAPSSTVATENRATRREREVRESAASAPPAAPAAPAPPRAPEATKEPASDLVPIVIVQIRAIPGRAATFVTDKGDTWVQTDSQRKLPDVPFKAAIKSGSMGSSFLVPDDYAHSFRVRHGQ